MLTLYVKTGCPFCIATLAKIAELNLEIEEKNISDDKIAKELIAKGGKKQVPYLIDSGRNVEMYESENIIEYLDANYGNGKGDEKKKDNNTTQVCTLEY